MSLYTSTLIYGSSKAARCGGYGHFPKEGHLSPMTEVSSWVYVITFDPRVTPNATFTGDFCRSQIDKAIGEQVQYDILSITIWKSDLRVADFYRSKTHPGAFLIGDAAHAFPPSGGLGINTGIADAQNLIWRIQAVENKWAGDSLLNSYDIERRPVAIANALQSATNGSKMRSLAMALFGPNNSEDPEIRMKDPKGRQGIEQGILDQFDHFNSVNLQLGYVYGDVSHSTKGACSVYIPSFAPEARLPHAWIQRNGSTCSTLDLIDGHSFVLLLSPNFKEASGTRHYLSSRKVPVQFLRAGLDFHDEGGNWSRSAGLDQDLGLLIRPDHHILCKIQNAEDLKKLELILENSLLG